MKQYLLNQDAINNAIMDIFESSSIYQEHPEYEQFAEEESIRLSESFVHDMEKYARQPDRNIFGNLNNIEYDYEREHYGEDFDMILTKADNGEFTDQELENLQDWCLGWFFKTFGTFGIKYNFESDLCDLIYEDECKLAF